MTRYDDIISSIFLALCKKVLHTTVGECELQLIHKNIEVSQLDIYQYIQSRSAWKFETLPFENNFADQFLTELYVN